MAEFYLKIGTGANYSDSDIVEAFNDRNIRRIHAQHLCKPDGFNKDGLRVPGCLADYFMTKTYQYKFQRVSHSEVVRTDLDTLEEIHFNSTPNELGQYMHVDENIRYMLDSPKHKIFGTTGNEYWYGGRKNYSNDRLTAIWNKIETDTPYREVDYKLMNVSERVLKRFLAVKVDDFSDTDGRAYLRPVYDETKALDENDKEVAISGFEDPIWGVKKLRLILLKKRNYKIEWRNLPGLSTGTESDILDKNIAVDIRKPCNLQHQIS